MNNSTFNVIDNFFSEVTPEAISQTIENLKAEVRHEDNYISMLAADHEKSLTIFSKFSQVSTLLSEILSLFTEAKIFSTRAFAFKTSNNSNSADLFTSFLRSAMINFEEFDMNTLNQVSQLLLKEVNIKKSIVKELNNNIGFYQNFLKDLQPLHLGSSSKFKEIKTKNSGINKSLDSDDFKTPGSFKYKNTSEANDNENVSSFKKINTTSVHDSDDNASVTSTNSNKIRNANIKKAKKNMDSITNVQTEVIENRNYYRITFSDSSFVKIRESSINSPDLLNPNKALNEYLLFKLNSNKPDQIREKNNLMINLNPNLKKTKTYCNTPLDTFTKDYLEYVNKHLSSRVMLPVDNNLMRDLFTTYSFLTAQNIQSYEESNFYFIFSYCDWV